MELKVKDFAAMNGVSDSIVYRHIRQHREALGDRVVKRGKATWLTEEGQEYIRGLMTQQPLVMVDAEERRKYEELLEENRILYQKLDLAKDKLAELAQWKADNALLIASAEYNEKAMIAARSEAEKAAQEASEANQRANTLEKENKALQAEFEAYKKRPLWKRIFE